MHTQGNDRIGMSFNAAGRVSASASLRPADWSMSAAAFCCLLAVFAFGPAVSPAVAQEKSKHGGHNHRHDHKGHDHKGHDHKGHDHSEHGHGAGKGHDQQGVDPMMKMQMEMYRLGTPGEHHDHLQFFVGDWAIDGKFRMSPDMDWMHSTSRAKHESMLGGRFIAEHVDGEEMPGFEGVFKGFGVLGFDNQKQKYIGLWMDNMMTSIMSGSGTCDGKGQNIRMTSRSYHPRAGKEIDIRWEYEVHGPDSYTFRTYEPDMEGKDYLAMELKYTRKAGSKSNGSRGG